MNYVKNYEKLIETRKFLNRKKNEGIYYEKHHILPRCLGGTNEESNLILLTAKEHFIAHLLLTKMYEGDERKKMYFAFWAMCHTPTKQRIISASQYQFGKLLFSKAMKKNTPWNQGKIMEKEYKQKLSEAHKGKNHSIETKQKMSNAHKGKLVSIETRKKRSKSLKGRIFTDEWKRKMSDAKKGKTSNKKGCKLSEETKRKISETKKMQFRNKKSLKNNCNI